MTDIRFLSAIKNDERLRRSIVHSISPYLFGFIRSPVEYKSADIQSAFQRDVEEAIFQFRNALDSLVYLRSKGWAHGTSMHQVMENAHRQIENTLENISAERYKAIGYAGPVSVPSVISIAGSEHAAVQVDELVPEGCFMAVPLEDGKLVRDKDGTLHPSKESWLQIDSVIRPFEDKDGIEDIKQDFTKYWQKTEFGTGPYHREYLIHLMRNMGM
ncbi:hypothetical protein [Rhizobium sp. BK176]|uniref:hypothetical protein n=1 Tax=Rhizobium sp. BK176 TaxID=2587071 RepID=UPI00216A5F44|nr:hypothetical protein [Rhizobium sp. BK176]MCS4089213.1 hypothetical protein [Rhizobium sp. BK176]